MNRTVICILFSSLTLTVALAQHRPRQQHIFGRQNQQYKRQSTKYGPPGYTPGEPLGLPTKTEQQQKCPPNDPKANKELVKRMYQELFGDHNLANIDNYFHQDLIEHNPMFADGLDVFKAAVGPTGPFGMGPKFQVDIKRISAEDNLVWTHTKFPLSGKEFAIADIFGFECRKIKEHWDVLQDIELKTPSANPHPFF